MTPRAIAPRCLLMMVAALMSTNTLARALSYPVTRKIDHVDDYHGTRVADPYRWLEDETSPETAAWVEAENAVTFPYLEKIPFRAKLQERVKELANYERYSAPSEHGPYFFYSHNTGLQNQSVLFMQRGVDAAAEELIDPNAWSADGTEQLAAFAPSKDAKYAVYGISKSGAFSMSRVISPERSSERPIRSAIRCTSRLSSAAVGAGTGTNRRRPSPSRR
jgi:prolyl oligopeptidase